VTRTEIAVWVVLGLSAAVIAVYFLALLVRGPSTYWTWLDGWVICAVELTVGSLCVARGLVRRPGRMAAVILGVSLLCWALGDVVLTIQSIGGATPPSPSSADIFYIAFYPLAYVAVVLFMRDQSRKLTVTNWLDGAIAGLGAAAICAAFIFNGTFHADGARLPGSCSPVAWRSTSSATRRTCSNTRSVPPRWASSSTPSPGPRRSCC